MPFPATFLPSGHGGLIYSPVMWSKFWSLRFLAGVRARVIRVKSGGSLLLPTTRVVFTARVTRCADRTGRLRP